MSLSIERHGFVITHTAYADNIADTETLPEAIGEWQEVCGRPHPNWPQTVFIVV